MLKQLILLAIVTPTILNAIDVKKRGNPMDFDEPTADAQLERADSVFQSRDYQAALQEYMTAFQQAEAEFNRPIEVEALAQIARMHLILDKKEEGRQWLEKAQGLAAESEPMGWSRLLGVRGRFEWKDNDLAAAKKTFYDMYVFCNTNGLFSRAVDAAHMIAIVAQSPEEQMEWGRRGIEAAEAGGVERWLGPLWNNLAGTYYDMKEYDSALACYLKAREYHWHYSDETAKLFADYHVGMTYRLVGKLNEAEHWLRPVLAWAERLNNHSAIGQALEDLAEIQITRGNKTDGIKMLKRTLKEYQAAGFDKSWPELPRNIASRIKALEQQ